MQNGARYIVTTHWGTFSLDAASYQDYLAGKLWISWVPGKQTESREKPEGCVPPNVTDRALTLRTEADKVGMHIYLVVFSSSAFELSSKLFHSVESYIDENYILDKTLDEYGIEDKQNLRQAEREQMRRELKLQRRLRARADLEEMTLCSSVEMAVSAPATTPIDWDELLVETDAGFSETLLKLIDKTGKKDSDIYKKANVDRKLFSKIRNNPEYKPSKTTAIAFAIALELNLDDTKDLIGRAGFALSHSSKFDIIIEYFIKQNNYDIFEINEALFAFDQSLLGA